jgi:hypothetical protein
MVESPFLFEILIVSLIEARKSVPRCLEDENLAWSSCTENLSFMLKYSFPCINEVLKEVGWFVPWIPT